MDIVFVAKVDKENLVFNDPSRFREYLRSLDGQVVDVIVRKPKKPRSNNQNAYMWAVPYQLLSETTGYTPNEIHDALRMLFLLDRSRKIPTLRSTTELSTVEMEDYLSKIRIWASQELNCYIPEPNEVNF